MGKILRSMLFVPANSWRMIQKACEETPDAVILDLEDAVPVSEKETARVLARDSIALFKEKDISVFARVNSLPSGLPQRDLSYVVSNGLDGIMLAKSETKEDIIALDKFVQAEERKRDLELNKVGIIPLVESPKGILNVKEILAGSPRVMAVGFGAADFLRELGQGFATTRLSPEEYFSAILNPRSTISIAASAFGIPAIDTPFFGLLTDTAGLIMETQKSKLLGFKGKMLIHPRHIDPVNQIFSPSEEEIDFAKQMTKAYDESKARGLGAASFGGRMIDFAMYATGLELIARAKTIARKGSGRP